MSARIPKNCGPLDKAVEIYIDEYVQNVTALPLVANYGFQPTRLHVHTARTHGWGAKVSVQPLLPSRYTILTFLFFLHEQRSGPAQFHDGSPDRQ